MNFWIFDTFITRYSMNLLLYNLHKQYGGRRREATIAPDWKQAWNQLNNQNRENIHIEEL